MTSSLETIQKPHIEQLIEGILGIKILYINESIGYREFEKKHREIQQWEREKK